MQRISLVRTINHLQEDYDDLRVLYLDAQKRIRRLAEENLALHNECKALRHYIEITKPIGSGEKKEWRDYVYDALSTLES